ncbi:MAG TPA: hypothetical protein VER03_09970 [Bryobacteraceae bacterium]|nr:hypothetical protein [Bryobacteraceae bacterium]
MTPENPLGRLFASPESSAPDSASVELHPVLQRRSFTAGLTPSAPVIEEEVEVAWPAAPMEAEPRYAVVPPSPASAPREERVVEHVRVERIVESAAARTPENVPPTPTVQPVAPVATESLKKPNQPVPPIETRAGNSPSHNPPPDERRFEQSRHTAPVAPLPLSQLPSRTGDAPAREPARVKEAAREQGSVPPVKRVAAPTPIANAEPAMPRASSEPAPLSNETKPIYPSPKEIPTEAKGPAATPAANQKVQPVTPPPAPRVETRIEAHRSPQHEQPPVELPAPQALRPAATTPPRPPAPAGITVKIGRIEIIARGKSPAKPPPPRVSRVARGHQIDPRLPFGRW